jgi:hypothetical protein
VPQNPLVYGSDWKVVEDDATKAKRKTEDRRSLGHGLGKSVSLHGGLQVAPSQ